MEWSNFNGVVRFSNGGNSSDGRLNAATVQSSIGTRITSYQLTISPLRTPPPRSPMPDPPFKPISIIIRRYIGTYLPGLDRILEKLSISFKKKNTLRSTAHRSLPQRMNQSYLHSRSPPSSTTTPSSSKFNFRRIMQGKLRQTRVCLSINHTCLQIPRPAQTPRRRDKIDRTRYFEFRI